MHDDISVPLILASQSPRRKSLLEEYGYEFSIIPPGDEAESGMIAGESPRAMVARLARAKAADVAGRLDEGVVIGCDTVAECRGQVLGKPRDRGDAERMLRQLRGQQHAVLSGLCVWRRPHDETRCDVATTILQMDAISDAHLAEYLNSGRWRGKAGAFGYQDGNDWLTLLEGSASNVVGLPMELLESLLAELP